MRHYLIVSIIVSNRDISYISSSVPHTIQFQSVLPARLQIAYIHPRQYFCCHWKVHFQIFGRDLKGGSHYGRLFWLASRLFRAPSQKPGCPAPGACLFLVVREAVLPEMSQMRPPPLVRNMLQQNKTSFKFLLLPRWPDTLPQLPPTLSLALRLHWNRWNDNDDIRNKQSDGFKIKKVMFSKLFNWLW